MTLARRNGLVSPHHFVPRRIRIEYPGAICYVTSRGDWDGVRTGSVPGRGQSRLSASGSGPTGRPCVILAFLQRVFLHGCEIGGGQTRFRKDSGRNRQGRSERGSFGKGMEAKEWPNGDLIPLPPFPCPFLGVGRPGFRPAGLRGLTPKRRDAASRTQRVERSPSPQPSPPGEGARHPAPAR